MKYFLHLSFFLCFGLIPILVNAQKSRYAKGDSFFKVAEHQLVETKWKYTYALHLESNTIIHKAENAYDYFLHFRYDNTYQQYLNDKFSQGSWHLVENELLYSFKHIQKFIVADINKKALVLEFTQTNSKGTYQYHFIRVSSENSPFAKPLNELPDVLVEALNPQKKESRWWVFRPKKKKRNRKDKPKENQPYISIEVIGGGFYGGINPTLRDYIQIKSDGRLIKEYKSVQNGLVVTKRNIPRTELEAFAEYIIAQNFFEMQGLYDCETALCLQRKKVKPSPIPLRLAVAYGNRRKVVTISIWGKDKHHARYVDYPPALDKIIAAIQKMSYRMDPS